MLFLIDYERGRRLKICGRATVIDDPALFARVSDRNYPAKVERVVRIDVQAWDLNCVVRPLAVCLLLAQGCRVERCGKSAAIWGTPDVLPT
jgi:hypothetical protein